MKLKYVAMWVCEACLYGEGEECHTPGCALYLHSVDLPIDDRIYKILDEFETPEAYSPDKTAQSRRLLKHHILSTGWRQDILKLSRTNTFYIRVKYRGYPDRSALCFYSQIRIRTDAITDNIQAEASTAMDRIIEKIEEVHPQGIEDLVWVD